MRSLARPILSALISTPRALLPRSSPLLRSVRPSQSTPPSLPFPQQQQSRAFTQTTTRALARVQLIGRLAAEPEVVVTGTGQQIVKYAIGVGSGPAENRKTSWFKIAYFSRGEEDAVEKRLMGMGRGSLLFIEGDCKLGSYEGSDGKTHTAFNITHRNFELLKRSENAETSASGDMQDGQFGASEVASA